jgi:O-antigen ligase
MVWIPTVLVMILSSRPVSLWLAWKGPQLGIENANDLPGNIIDQIFIFSVLASSLVITMWRRMKWGKLLWENRAILFFYLYFLFSVLWSSDPTGSTKRIFKDFGLLFVIGVILTERKPLQAMVAVYVRSAFLLLPLSMVLIKYFPAVGRGYSLKGEVMITGVATERNLLGEIVMIFTFFLVWDYLEMRRTNASARKKRIPLELLVLLFNGLWLLHLCQSKTALICTIVGAFLIVRSGKLMSKPINSVVWVCALSLPVLVFFSAQFSGVIAPIIQVLGRNMTFTGRTDIWQHIDLTTVNPFFGAGYYNFWGGPDGYKVNLAMHGVIPNAHNGYLDLYLDGGFIGLALLFILIVHSGRGIMKRIFPRGDVNHYQRIRFAVMVAAIIYNVSESTFARISPIWFTALLMMVNYPPLMVHTANAKESVKRRKVAAWGLDRASLSNEEAWACVDSES